ncbi:dihydrodipicolinate synthase family protein [Kineobactrum salinum]|uniref:Dihydrodipicolinate synthase family protein n=1 Tax=Kineobactrum salinum TaxID=2708301 RepID=A0A6C0TWF9_9GAMM|nr:dihydrodipicolinate synthase family protein [Kineobactrum salinum]QIB64150.1 dihydrodipicolinate synthase family protein [Kineobactrum salinum]
MNRDSVNWRGYIPAMTTPFTGTGELDVPALRKHVDWLVGQGMHGLVVAGTQGEWFTLNLEEKATLLREVAAGVKGRIPLIAGCSGYTLADVLIQVELAERAGFDGILLTPPPYMVPSEADILAFYRSVDAAIRLPICVYNWPPGTHVDMSPGLLAELAQLEQVVAIKNSTQDLRRFLDTFFRLRRQVRVFGIPMNETGATLVKQHDADGTMGAGAVLGHEQPDFFNELWAGNEARALEYGARDYTIMQRWFNPDLTGRFGSSQAIFKEALNQQGLYGGYPRLPLQPLNAAGVEQIRATLAELGRLELPQESKIQD